MLMVTGYGYFHPSELPRFHADLQTLAVTVRQRMGNVSYDTAVDDPQAGRLLIAER